MGCGSLVSGAPPPHIPVGTWQHCSSPQLWQKGQGAHRSSWQTVSQWLWGFGERERRQKDKKVQKGQDSHREAEGKECSKRKSKRE